MTVKMTGVPFEEALTMTGFGRYTMELMTLTSCIIVAMAFETFSVAFLVPASGCELRTTPEQQGLMAGIPLIGILAASNVWGYLADTRGRRKILLVALTLGFITGCCATISPNWIFFCVCKFLSASAMAGIFGLSNTYVSECIPQSRRPRLIVLLTSIFAVAVGCMAALTIPVLPMTFSYEVPFLNITFNSWRLLNLIFSMPCAIAAVGSYFSLESPKFLLSIGEDKQALDVLKKIFEKNTREDGDRYKVTSINLGEGNAAQTAAGFWASVVKQTVPLLKPPLLQNTLLLSVIFVAVYFCVTPFTTWVPYMVDGFMKSLEKGDRGLTYCQMLRSSQNDTDEVDTNSCTLNNSAMLMVFCMDMILATLNILVSIILPYVGRKKMLISIQMIAGAAALLMNVSTSWPLTAVLFIIFISGMLNFGLLSTFSVDMFPTYVKAMGVCFTLMVGRASAALGINILKNLLTYHCEYSFYIFGSIAIGGSFLSFMLPSDKAKKIEQVETKTETS